jgi:hypothetical protein
LIIPENYDHVLHSDVVVIILQKVSFKKTPNLGVQSRMTEDGSYEKAQEVATAL